MCLHQDNGTGLGLFLSFTLAVAYLSYKPHFCLPGWPFWAKLSLHTFTQFVGSHGGPAILRALSNQLDLIEVA